MSVSRLFLNDTENCLYIEADGLKLPAKFHYLWLRDHCRCNICYNKKTHQIVNDILKISTNIKIIDFKNDNDKLIVTWDDGHMSEYLFDTLINLKSSKTREITLWNKTNIDKCLNIVSITKKEYFEPNGCKRLLENILKYGFAFVTNVDRSMEATRIIAEHVASIQKTYFGEMWEVSNDYYHKDTAYTTIALGAHNDNTYFTNAAGLQVFHMLSHEGTGGETLLVDGFNVANYLKIKNEKNFNILCTKPIESQYIENDRHYINVDTVIKLHPSTNQLLQIRYNIYDRGVLNTLQHDEVMEFYDSYRLFGEEIKNPNNELWIKLPPGTVCFIDNWRVLHGRASYTGLRKLVGCYISRDDWLAKAKGFNLH